MPRRSRRYSRARRYARRSRKFRTSLSTRSQMYCQVEKFAPGILAFVSQLTSKDTAYIASQPGIAAQAKTLVNDVVGRVTGINPFPGSPQFPQSINPAGVINKWTGMGVAAFLYGKFAPKGMPAKASARRIGASLAIGGILGGFFDPGSGSRSGGMSARGTQGAGGPAGGPASRASGFGGTNTG